MCLARLRAPPSRRSLLARRSTYQAGFLSVLYSIGAKPLQIWDKKVRNGHIKRITDSDIQSSTLEICGSNVSTTFITCPADPKKTLGIKLPFLVMVRSASVGSAQARRRRSRRGRARDPSHARSGGVVARCSPPGQLRGRLTCSPRLAPRALAPCFACRLLLPPTSPAPPQIIKNLKKYFTFEVTVLDDKNVHRRFRASNYQSTTRVKPFICTMPMRLDEGWNQIQFNLSDFTRRAYGTNYVETLRVQIHANCRVRRIYFSDRLYTEDELPTEFKLYIPVKKSAAAAGGAAAAGATAPAAAAPAPAAEAAAAPAESPAA